MKLFVILSLFVFNHHAQAQVLKDSSGQIEQHVNTPSPKKYVGIQTQLLGKTLIGPAYSFTLNKYLDFNSALGLWLTKQSIDNTTNSFESKSSFCLTFGVKIKKQISPKSNRNTVYASAGINNGLFHERYDYRSPGFQVLSRDFAINSQFYTGFSIDFGQNYSFDLSLLSDQYFFIIPNGVDSNTLLPFPYKNPLSTLGTRMALYFNLSPNKNIQPTYSQ